MQEVSELNKMELTTTEQQMKESKAKQSLNKTNRQAMQKIASKLLQQM